MTTMFAATHHAMSVEDPERGDVPYTKWLSADKAKLLEAIRVEMTVEGDFDSIEVKEVSDEFGDETHVLGNFEPGDEMQTYYIIRAVEVL